MACVPDDARWREEIRRRDAERAHDRSDAFLDQLNEAAISAGTVTLRTAVLVNGGAAVAVLAFVGNLLNGNTVPEGGLGAITRSLTWFAAGVACAVAGMGLGYLTNYAAGALRGSP